MELPWLRGRSLWLNCPDHMTVSLERQRQWLVAFKENAPRHPQLDDDRATARALDPKLFPMPMCRNDPRHSSERLFNHSTCLSYLLRAVNNIAPTNQDRQDFCSHDPRIKRASEVFNFREFGHVRKRSVRRATYTRRLRMKRA